jgi:hypothetical protein
MMPPILPPARPSPLRLAGFGILLTGVCLALTVFSAFPWIASPPGLAVVRVAFRHVTAFEEGPGGQLSREELEKLPKHMRPLSGERARTGARRDTLVRVMLGEQVLLARTYRPSGFRHDGPTFGYEEIAVPAGRHRIDARLADAGGEEGAPTGRWHVTRELDIRPGQAVLVELSEQTGLTIR